MGRLLIVTLTLLAFKSGECNQFCKMQGLDSGTFSDPVCVCVRKINYSELYKVKNGLIFGPPIEEPEPYKPYFRIDEDYNFED